MQQPTGESATAVSTAVRTVLDRLVSAWERHDAEAYGELFTEDATYITYVGTFYRGRRDIVDSHRALFSGFLKGTRLADEILDVRFYGPDTAVVNGRGDTYKGKRPAKLTKIQTYTLVRDADGSWRIAAFQNTKRKPLMEAVSYRFAPDLVPAAER
ncbi:SgcJ/EcaC family oxidoreductase [Streptomyces sp. NBC_01264]|uniref:SgcJ/EcaC family oxidoreductase n=1 Tax=Streptomyces sp. NBC_01264 TaxID=2903804 RepID=UPI00225B6D81|nr:SgcJ/EcaC family oxidoreductase [Streptomyces sp. NBC_01264]MCX4777733.1 SgcJ/EcaC family oxidoreductase [Streptomyces sp. NBC_01264]